MPKYTKTFKKYKNKILKNQLNNKYNILCNTQKIMKKIHGHPDSYPLYPTTFSIYDHPHDNEGPSMPLLPLSNPHIHSYLCLILQIPASILHFFVLHMC